MIEHLLSVAYVVKSLGQIYCHTFITSRNTLQVGTHSTH